MLEQIKSKEFDKIFDIMKGSFPEDEYRNYDEQLSLFDDSDYAVYVLRGENKSVKAFIAVWNFTEFLYVEHFAVALKFRNEGIGAEILNEVTSNSDKIVCLEVEPPESEMPKRRINFYKRNGFFLNDFPYQQPALSKNKKPLKLFLMTSENTVGKDEFEKIKNVLYHRVYKLQKAQN